MSKWFNKLFTSLIIVAIAVAALTSFRAGLLSQNADYDAFIAVFESFPFAREMAEIMPISVKTISILIYPILL